MTTRPLMTAPLLAALVLTLTVAGCADEGDPAEADAADTSADGTALDTDEADVTDVNDDDTTATDVDDDTTTADDTGSPDAADTLVADTASPDVSDVDDQDTALPACTRTGFVPAAQAAEGEDTFAAWYGATSSTTPTDRATFEVLDLPRQPFTFEFTGENYKDCDVCLTFGTTCDNMSCEKTLLAISGTADVTSWGMVGESFAGTMTDIVAVEVTIADDFTSTPVDGGEVLCIELLAFDATLTPL